MRRLTISIMVAFNWRIKKSQGMFLGLSETDCIHGLMLIVTGDSINRAKEVN